MMRPFFILILLWFTFVQSVSANPFQRLNGGALNPSQAFQYDIFPDGTGGAEIHWRITEGYYLYRDNIFAKDASGKGLALETPDGELRDDLNFGTVEIYPRDVVVRLSGAYGNVTLGWQGCQDQGICYAPQTAVIELPSGVSSDLAKGSVTEVDTLKAKGGVLWVLAGFAGLGLLLAFTPCSFPMLPILWAILGGAKAGSSRAIGIAGAYVAGMAAGFGLIGALAGWIGAGLQFMLQQPWVILTSAGVFFLLAVASIDLIPLKMPAAVTRRLASTKGRGTFAGAVMAGLASVLILGPCVTAPLAGALIYIAQSGDVALGAAALAMLGLGQGLPLMALALFGKSILPQSGAWLATSRYLFAALLAAMGVWLATRVLSGPEGLLLWAVLAFAFSAGVYGTGFLRRFVAITLFAIGLVQLIGAGAGGSDPLRPLSLSKASAQDIASHRVDDLDGFERVLASNEAPLRITYVTADWCVTCRALERDIFSDSTVQAAVKDIPFIKADVTDFNGSGGELAQSLGVVGPPTVLFLDESGAELPLLRLTGSFSRDQFLTTLKGAQP